MTNQYRCDKCGTVTRATHHSSPQRGDYERVKCPCGNSGSDDYDYRRGTFIEGFTRMEIIAMSDQIDGKEKSNE